MTKGTVYFYGALIGLLLFFISPKSHGDDHSQSNPNFENTSFSFFASGNERLYYSESLSNFTATSFKSGFNNTGIIQRSGGYTAISEDSSSGFFITTQSTLIAEDNIEEWNAAGFDVVQTNSMGINHASLDLIAVHHFKNGHFVMAGMHYQKIAFSRFDFNNTATTSAFSDFALDNSASYQAFKEQIDNGETLTAADGSTITTDAELRDALRFDPEQLARVLFEDITSFSGMAGVGYDSFFINRQRGMRYKYQLLLGTPIYTHVLNTNVEGSDKVIRKEFSGGLDILLSASLGYQLNQKLSIMFGVHYLKSERDSISKGTVQKITLPNNEFEGITPEFGFYWAF